MGAGRPRRQPHARGACGAARSPLAHHAHAADALEGLQLLHGGGGHGLVEVEHRVGGVAAGLVRHVLDVHALLAEHVGDTADHAGDVLVHDGRAAHAGGARAHVACGEVHRVLDVAVLQVVHHLLHGHGGAVVLRLGGRGAQVGQHDRVLHLHHLGRGEVGDVDAHLARRQRRGHGGVVHERVAREVQHHGAILHERAGAPAHHADGAFHGRHMDGEVVAGAEDVVQVRDVMDGARDAPRRAHRDVRIVAVHVHAQRHGRVRHLGADGAQADDAQLLALDLAAGELLLRLLHRLGDIRIVGVVTAPCDAVHDAAASQQERAQNDLLHGIGIGTRRVEHDDALLGAAVRGDVVHARPRARDGQQAVAERHVVHGSAAHEYGRRLRGVVGKLVGVGEQVGAVRGNVVQAVDVAHGSSPSLV